MLAYKNDLILDYENILFATILILGGSLKTVFLFFLALTFLGCSNLQKNNFSSTAQNDTERIPAGEDNHWIGGEFHSFKSCRGKLYGILLVNGTREMTNGTVLFSRKVVNSMRAPFIDCPVSMLDRSDESKEVLCSLSTIRPNSCEYKCLAGIQYQAEGTM